VSKYLLSTKQDYDQYLTNHYSASEREFALQTFDDNVKSLGFQLDPTLLQKEKIVKIRELKVQRDAISHAKLKEEFQDITEDQSDQIKMKIFAKVPSLFVLVSRIFSGKIF